MNLELNQKSISSAALSILDVIKTINPDNPMQYVIDIVKPYAIEKLNEKISLCSRCPISNNKHRSYVSGNIESDLLIICDYINSANDTENYIHTPLEDETSYVTFSEALDLIDDVDINSFAYCNIVNCVPCNIGCDSTRLPTKKELYTCSEHIVKEVIEIMRPKMLLVLGNTPLRAFSDYNFSAVRGQMVDILNIPTMVTYAPSYFEKMSSIKDAATLAEEYQNFLKDLNLAFQYLKDIK